jgi:hypothetical protein
MHDHPAIAQALIGAGADPNLQNKVSGRLVRNDIEHFICRYTRCVGSVGVAVT